MVSPSKHPQEIEYWYVLPAIRKELVLALKNKGKNQKEIAKLLNLTEPAVSQYLNKKRAKDFPLTKDVVDFIRKSADKITGEKEAYQQIQKICDYIKETKALCRIHMDVESGLEGCDLCYNN